MGAGGTGGGGGRRRGVRGMAGGRERGQNSLLCRTDVDLARGEENALLKEDAKSSIIPSRERLIRERRRGRMGRGWGGGCGWGGGGGFFYPQSAMTVISG